MSRTEVIDVTGALPPPAAPVVEAPAPWWRRVLSVIDPSDVVVFIGLGLWMVGFWGEWRIALGVPGAVLVAWALPPRPPFVQRDVSRERG